MIDYDTPATIYDLMVRIQLDGTAYYAIDKKDGNLYLEKSKKSKRLKHFATNDEIIEILRDFGAM